MDQSSINAPFWNPNLRQKRNNNTSREREFYMNIRTFYVLEFLPQQ